MNDPKNPIEKDDIDRQVDQIQKLLTAAAGYDPRTCTQEQQAKVVRNDKGEVEIESFAPGSMEQMYAQIKMLKLFEFFIAIQNKNLAKIKDLIEKELVDIDAKTPFPKSPISETTALGIAINQGNSEEIIKYLIAKGANPKLAYDDFKKAGNIDGINQLIKIAPDSVQNEFYESE